MSPQGRGVWNLDVFDPGDRTQYASRVPPIKVLLRVARLVMKRHPLLDSLRETDPI
jgi:hypothetical protein